MATQGVLSRFRSVLSLVFILFVSATNAVAQLTGRVDMPEIGLSFVIPEHWVGQPNGDVFVMGGMRDPGLILMVQHEYSTLDEIRSEARQGIVDTGVSLQLKGDMVALGLQALGGQFEGTLEGHPAIAYVVAVLNPHGAGVTVMAMTDRANFSPRHKQLAEQVSSSLVFAKVDTSVVTRQAEQLLNHTRLNYMSSYTSGTSGGMNSQRYIDLCPNKRFNYSSSSFLSIDVGGAYGSSHGARGGSGRWAVSASSSRQAVLELHFDEGEVWRYDLNFNDGQTRLNNVRYFRIGANDPNGNGPRCSS